MKKISFYLLSCLFIFSAHTQPYSNTTVTITVNSSFNTQITLDGRNYALTTGTATGNKSSLTVNDLDLGQHSILVTRSYLNNAKTDRIPAIFGLRYGYNMQINVNGNGSLELLEKKQDGIVNNGIPVNNTVFAALLRNVRNQYSTNNRRTVIANAFNRPNYYFTTLQVRQLLQQVNSESYRLELAKMAYSRTTDRNNFHQLYSTLNSQASRSELEDYVNNHEDDNYPYTAAMSDTDFNALYQNTRQQWPAASRLTSLTNTFTTPSNYFTTAQAKQLIELANTESSRLQLARLSYRSITDPGNFIQLNSLFNNQASKDNLAIYVANYTKESVLHPAMPDAGFTALYQAIQQQWPAGTQVKSLGAAFTNTSNYFTTYQARQLIQLIPDESNRLQLARQSYRSITDPVRFSDMYSLFNNTANRADLVNFVNNYQGGEYNVNAMSDADFTTLYQSIERQFMPNEQLNTLTTVFNKTGNYFVTSQARKLIQLVSFESNRLQLAKLSYRTITDRNNFSSLYDLLDNQSNRNELDAYAKAYND